MQECKNGNSMPNIRRFKMHEKKIQRFIIAFDDCSSMDMCTFCTLLSNDPNSGIKTWSKDIRGRLES